MKVETKIDQALLDSWWGVDPWIIESKGFSLEEYQKDPDSFDRYLDSEAYQTFCKTKTPYKIFSFDNIMLSGQFRYLSGFIMTRSDEPVTNTTEHAEKLLVYGFGEEISTMSHDQLIEKIKESDTYNEFRDEDCWYIKFKKKDLKTWRDYLSFWLDVTAWELYVLAWTVY